MSELGPQIRGIRDLGVCNPSEVSEGPIPVISTRQLQQLLQNISGLKREGIRFHEVVLNGNASQPFPPNSLRFAQGLLDRIPELGLLHWREGRASVIQWECLEGIAGRLSAKTDFAYLIVALQSAGWQARDIAFSLTPCEPFFQSEPTHTEERLVALMSVVTTDDRASSQEWLSKGLQSSHFGSWGNAVTCFEHALEFDPGNVPAWVGEAAALFRKKRYNEALYCCDCCAGYIGYLFQNEEINSREEHHFATLLIVDL